MQITNSNEQIAKDFKLYQNYPNPFNPVTGIKFQVASIKHIKLVVYNILGKEVTILVNEKLQSGTYEVKFDVARYGGLSTGIYFYSLYSEGILIDTKKLVLIK